MNSYKSLTIATMVLNFMIIVEVGHGIACLGLCEMDWFFSLFLGEAFHDFTLSLTASYADSIGPIALFSLVGNVLLISSFYIKKRKVFMAKLLGILFLWIGFFYLTHYLVRDDTSRLSFYVGLPFLICSIVLSCRIIRQQLK